MLSTGCDNLMITWMNIRAMSSGQENSMDRKIFHTWKSFENVIVKYETLWKWAPLFLCDKLFKQKSFIYPEEVSNSTTEAVCFSSSSFFFKLQKNLVLHMTQLSSSHKFGRNTYHLHAHTHTQPGDIWITLYLIQWQLFLSNPVNLKY